MVDMQKYAYIAGTLGFTAFGQLMIKARALTYAGAQGPRGQTAYLTAMFTDVGVWSGLAAAVVASVCWTLAMQRTPLSLAYPFMALSFLLVPALSVVLLGETVTLWQVIGLMLIVAGVVLNGAAQ